MAKPIFTTPHPMADAPRDVQVACLVAAEFSWMQAQRLLCERLEVFAGNGDRKAAALLGFAAELEQAPQTVVWSNQFGWCAESLEQSVRRLVEHALNSRTLSAAQIGQLFGVGLITKADHGELKAILAENARAAG